ncbi:MAG: preprotein translocase subunit YajC [Candidatus Brocadiia bacterium]
MNAIFASAVVLAAEVGEQAAGQAAGAADEQPSLLQAVTPLIPIVLIFGLFIWFTTRSQKKRQREREQMLESLSPKDDVYTIGGIKGRIVSIEDDEVTLRIDTEKDIKITVTRGGIGRKVGEEQPG